LTAYRLKVDQDIVPAWWPARGSRIEAQMDERVSRCIISDKRKIHVALPDDVHQKLRMKCALEDVTIQEYVSRLIEQDVKDVLVPALNKNGRASR